MSTVISRRALALVVLSVFGVLLAACGGSQSKDPIELVPAKAELLASVDLPAILADADVRKAYEIIAGATNAPSTPATLDDLLAKAEDELGLDLTTFGKVLVFAEMPPMGSSGDSPGYGGVIAQGAPDGLFDKVKASAGASVTEADYKGVALLEDDGTSVAIVDGSAVIGSSLAVHDVIDIAKGDAAALTGDAISFHQSLGDVWAKGVLILSDDMKAQLQSANSGDIGVPVDVSALLGFDAAGISLNKSGTDATARIVLRYATSDQATNAADAINALLTLAKTLGSDNQVFQQLSGLKVSADGVDLVIEETADVQEALNSLQEMVDTFGGSVPSVGGFGL